jgi:hypothetical protein
MFQTKVVEKNQNTHFVFKNFFSFENRTVYEIMLGGKKYGTAGHTTDDNTAHAHCLPDT